MLAVIAMLERGYEQTFEHLCWRQIKAAFQVDQLICVGHDCSDMSGAFELLEEGYQRVFVVPPGRTNKSVEFGPFVIPTWRSGTAYIFGRPGDNLVRYIADADLAVHITTLGIVDMMAVTVAGIVLRGN